MTRLDITKEARRWMRQRAAENSGMSQSEMREMIPLTVIGAEINSCQLEAFARRLLRRAAGEVEKLRAVEEWKFEHGEVERERFNEGVEWSRDHLRALACPPRRTRK